jgi:transposase-like protein
MTTEQSTTFEDEEIIQHVRDDQGVECPICTETSKVRYRLVGESRTGACCAGCFLAWLLEHDATVTMTYTP